MSRLLWLLVSSLHKQPLPEESGGLSQAMGGLLRLAGVPSEDDLACVGRRQVFGSTEGVFAVEAVRCRHGFPRAFARQAVTSKVSSGMLRLSCPLLVKAIDEWEASGGIEEMNTALKRDLSLKQSFMAANEVWRDIRRHSVSESQEKQIMSVIGERGMRSFMESGIIGVSPGKTDDVKCIHAHVADHLLRGGEYKSHKLISSLCLSR